MKYKCRYCGKYTYIEHEDCYPTADGWWWHEGCHEKYLREKYGFS